MCCAASHRSARVGAVLGVPSRWILSPPDPRAGALGQALGLSPLTAQLLLNRGVVDAELARRYLEPRLADLRKPDGMAGFEVALGRLDRALQGNEIVGVFGD